MKIWRISCLRTSTVHLRNSTPTRQNPLSSTVKQKFLHCTYALTQNNMNVITRNTLKCSIEKFINLFGYQSVFEVKNEISTLRKYAALLGKNVLVIAQGNVPVDVQFSAFYDWKYISVIYSVNVTTKWNCVKFRRHQFERHLTPCTQWMRKLTQMKPLAEFCRQEPKAK